MPRRTLKQLYQAEFTDYNQHKFKNDLLAGINVAAVALPLALAFGVVSGHTAAAGLVSAIIAGLVIGLLSGAPYQISGPTGATGAVLVVLIQKYGLQGMWLASIMAGLLLTFIGLLRLGRFITFIPSPVVTGFTSGIAVIIAISQLDNLLGTQTPRAAAPLLKLLGFIQGSPTPDWHALLIGGLALLIMAGWPTRWNTQVPGSLVGITAATVLNLLFNWPITTIGAIPATLLLDQHFTLALPSLAQFSDLVPPALTLTALAAIVSLLCGSSASALTGIRLQANQELIGQGIGNLIIPFFGGVPATGAVARTIVGIRSGGQTRLVSIIHALILLGCLLLLGPVLARVPLAALAGVLWVTSWRMNNWPAIRYMFAHQFKTAIITFLVTVIATTIFDLAQTVLIGAFLSGAVFLSQISDIAIEVQDVDPQKLRQRGIDTANHCRHVRVAYITGPLFFAATGNFNESFANLNDTQVWILSMRGVPLIDTSGLQAMLALQGRLAQTGSTLMVAGVHDNVKRMMVRGGLEAAIGSENFFWGADQAIVAAEKRGCRHCAAEYATRSQT